MLQDVVLIFIGVIDDGTEGAWGSALGKRLCVGVGMKSQTCCSMAAQAADGSCQDFPFQQQEVDCSQMPCVGIGPINAPTLGAYLPERYLSI